MAKGWIGSTETYTFTNESGSTRLAAEITTPPEWSDMFEDGQPRAIEQLAER